MAELQSKDLTMTAPRSPFERIEGFAILGRTIDKCRATIAGTNGEYHFNCPLDKMLLEFKGVDAEEFKAYVAEGVSDEEIGKWVLEHGTPKTAEEINAWSDSVDQTMYNEPGEKRDWFVGECEKLGLDPDTTSLFQYLVADDAASVKA